MPLDLDLTDVSTPPLEFGGPGEFPFPRLGLKEGGPFDLRFGGAHLDRVRLGLVGPSSTLDKAKEWFERNRDYLLSEKEDPVRFPVFPGFKRVYHADLLLDERWTVDLGGDSGSLMKALATERDKQRFQDVLDLYADGIKQLATMEISSPDVVVCCLPPKVVNKCWSISNDLSESGKEAVKKIKEEREKGQLAFQFSGDVEETEGDLLRRDFRRALKAEAMRYRMPIQLGTEGLFVDDRGNQGPAERAWNSTVALYYKAGGIPWRLKQEGPETCFAGVTFHHHETTQQHVVRSSVAQAFSSQGEGFALRGETVPWEEGQGRNVHLTEKQAFLLGGYVLEEYRNRTGGSPDRLVLHKTSGFNKEEQAGFIRASQDIPILELLHIKDSHFRLVRNGNYPPKRGLLCSINSGPEYLFTTGYIDKIGTYPGPHIPSPVQIRSPSEIDTHRAARDILGLSRMNWNTTGIKGGTPVTLAFARKVGGIMAEYGEEPPVSFRYYM
jgi:hypothetical protein